MEKIPLPSVIVDIVKDFCFLRLESVQRQKKNAMLYVLKNHVHIDVHYANGTDRYGHRHGDNDTREISTRFFVYNKNVNKGRYGVYDAAEPETYFTFQICSKCGDFINPKTKKDNACKIMRRFLKRPHKKHYYDVNPFYQVQCTHDARQATSHYF